MCDTENLIMCVQRHPCIWDTSTQDYHNKEIKDLAWLDVCKHVFSNWETLNEEEKKIKGLEVKKKWSNCRDYYKKDRQKLKTCPTGSAAKKGKRYVFADILNFLDKTTARRNHEGNYDTDDDNGVIQTDENTETSETTESRHEDEGDISNENSYKKKTSEEKERKKKKNQQDIPGEILNILKKKKTNKEYDDDEKFLLSFSGEMKRMTHVQKIEFKLGMMNLLKKTFQESVANFSSTYSSTPSPGYCHVYHDSPSQSRYANPQTIITIPRPISQPQQIDCPPNSQSSRALYNSDANQRVIINTIETISNSLPSNTHEDYYEFHQRDDLPNMTVSNSQTEEIATPPKDQLLSFLSFK